ncbi:hypothetical protein J2X04_001114 [Lysobacter niabensis]|uniref:DUF2884 family protein n=1 Tax=Agrilutibacter niabensis TaxID=380628 RepID=A0ABU1VMR2_9GAMM|nr:DUF2884 family protein [Lysobacter niabensis]MDR7098767.1 hypothetical protein [Lysobacter niabensis]
MNRIRTFACTALVASLAACQGSAPSTSTASKPPASTTQPTSSLGKMVDKEIRQAREKLATENVSVGSVHVHGNHSGVNISTDDNDNLPKAEITPKGDLLIEGKAVAINADQRALLMEYRAHIIGIAESGMDIGMQGADLAAKAVGEAFKGIFSGKSEQDIEKSVEAEAAGIKMAAAKLCGRLPDMMASQQKVAAAVPEFKPYATMTKEDIEDCFEESKQHANSSMNAAERAAAAATEANTQTKAATKAPTKSN